MGVHNLWKLLEPAGRRVDVATLRNKVIAVDVSIWLTAFVKAMRNADGTVMPNAHLLGTFRRVLRLLFHRIKPIFVFDGGVPALKRRTIMRRQEKRAVNEARHAQIARKIILSRMLQSAHATDGAEQVNGGAASTGFTSRSRPLLAASSSGSGGGDTGGGGDDGSGASSPPRSSQRSRTSPPHSGSSAQPRRRLRKGGGKSRASAAITATATASHLLIDDSTSGSESDASAGSGVAVVPTTSGGVDLSVLSSLPPHLQKQYIDELQRKQRAETRSLLLPMAADPTAFSRAQLKGFIVLSKFNRQVDKMHAENAAAHSSTRKIVSEVNKEYILEFDDSEDAGGMTNSAANGSHSSSRGGTSGVPRSGAGAGAGASAAGTRSPSSDGFLEPSDRERMAGFLARGRRWARGRSNRSVVASLAAPSAASRMLQFVETGAVSAGSSMRHLNSLMSNNIGLSGHLGGTAFADAAESQSAHALLQQQLSLELDSSPTNAPLYTDLSDVEDVTDIQGGGGATIGSGTPGFTPSDAEDADSDIVQEVVAVSSDDEAASAAAVGSHAEEELAAHTSDSTHFHPTDEVVEVDDDSSEDGGGGGFMAEEGEGEMHAGGGGAAWSDAAGVQQALLNDFIKGRGAFQAHRAQAAPLDTSTDAPSDGQCSPPPPGRDDSPVMDSPSGTHAEGDVMAFEEDKGLRATLHSDATHFVNAGVGATAFSSAVDVVEAENGIGDDGEWEDIVAERQLPTAAATPTAFLLSHDLHAVDASSSSSFVAQRSPSALENGGEKLTASSYGANADGPTTGASRVGPVPSTRKVTFSLTDTTAESHVSLHGSAYGGIEASDVDRRSDVRVERTSTVAVSASDSMDGMDAQPTESAQPSTSSSVQPSASSYVSLLSNDGDAVPSGFDMHPQVSAGSSLDNAPSAAWNPSFGASDTRISAPSGIDTRSISDAYALAGSMRSWAKHAFSRALKTMGVSMNINETERGSHGHATPSASASASASGEDHGTVAATVGSGSLFGGDGSRTEQPAPPSSVEQTISLVDDDMEEEDVPIIDLVDAHANMGSGSSPDDRLRAPTAAASGAGGSRTTFSPASTPSATSSSAGAGVGAYVPPTDAEVEALRASSRTFARDADTVTEAMKEEVIALLRLFGLPYIIAPMEAEAQCAQLELAGLVEGVITDDSDAFLFGARSVHRNIFDESKYVETYQMADITAELGVGREDLVRSALLLGSDYTDGVLGVGPVNATEILLAFPGDEGLKVFNDWLTSLDGDGLEEPTEAQRRFIAKHKAAKRNWQVPPDFPSAAVLSAYRNPQVTHVDAASHFDFNPPDYESLKVLCVERFGWDETKVKSELGPTMRATAERTHQVSLDSYMLSYFDHERAAKVKSTRLRTALEGLSGTTGAAWVAPPPAVAAASATASASATGTSTGTAIEHVGTAEVEVVEVDVEAEGQAEEDEDAGFRPSRGRRQSSLRGKGKRSRPPSATAGSLGRPGTAKRRAKTSDE